MYGWFETDLLNVVRKQVSVKYKKKYFYRSLWVNLLFSFFSLSFLLLIFKWTSNEHVMSYCCAGSTMKYKRLPDVLLTEKNASKNRNKREKCCDLLWVNLKFSVIVHSQNWSILRRSCHRWILSLPFVFQYSVKRRPIDK